MRIKRFEAPDNHSALTMVKKELGEDALILATRTISPPLRKNGAIIRVEVVAAVEYDQDISDSTAEPVTDAAGGRVSTYDYAAVRRENTSSSSIPAEILRKSFAPPDTKVQSANAKPLPGKKSSDNRDMKPTSSRQQQTAAGNPNQAFTKTPPQARLQGNTISRPSHQDIAGWREQLISQISVRPPVINRNATGPAIIALVGPTGVGKTTTAAKLAAWYMLHEGLKVTLVSMDCYRIGATDQLRSYARIMHLPCEITLRKAEFMKALARHTDQDVIIVDTAGKSPYDGQHVPELRDWFASVETIAPHLVVSATSKKEDLTHIFETYRPLKPAGIMVAKLDETRAYATLCQQLAASSLPVACLCTGQRVPEDFLMASREFLGTLFREGIQAASQEAGAA